MDDSASCTGRTSDSISLVTADEEVSHGGRGTWWQRETVAEEGQGLENTTRMDGVLALGRSCEEMAEAAVTVAVMPRMRRSGSRNRTEREERGIVPPLTLPFLHLSTSLTLRLPDGEGRGACSISSRPLP